MEIPPDLLIDNFRRPCYQPPQQYRPEDSMRNCLTATVIAVALVLSACNSGRSSRSNPTAFCSALKKIAVQSAGFQDNPTPSLAKEQAASVQQLVGIAPPELESAAKTEAAAWNQFVKTGNHSELVGKKYAAATDEINTWAAEYCK